MASLARDYATALRQQFKVPVDIVGVSTGGSVALQLAVDHPDVVRRLGIVSAAYRLGSFGQACQRDTAAALRAGRTRRAAAAMMSIMGAHAGTRRAMRLVGWLLGPILTGHGDTDLLTTLEAEASFDVHDRLPHLTAPVLVAGGDRDACYGPDLLHHTAVLIPHATAQIYPRRGPMGVQNRRVAGDILAFLNTP